MHLSVDAQALIDGAAATAAASRPSGTANAINCAHMPLGVRSGAECSWETLLRVRDLVMEQGGAYAGVYSTVQPHTPLGGASPARAFLPPPSPSTHTGALLPLCAGVVLLTGTDAMDEMAFVLSMLLHSRLVGELWSVQGRLCPGVCAACSCAAVVRAPRPKPQQQLVR